MVSNFWKSDLPRPIKINFFKPTIESILLYNAEAWSLTKSLNDELDGTYTRLLRHILNIIWRQHITNKELYKNLPMVSSTIRARRLRIAGHCWRSKKVAANLVLWRLSRGQRALADHHLTSPLSSRKTQDLKSMSPRVP